jgi:hypothetical protein
VQRKGGFEFSWQRATRQFVSSANTIVIWFIPVGPRISAVPARSFLDHYLVYPLAFAGHAFFTEFPPISAGWYLTCIFLPGVLPIRTFMTGKPSAS